jgi:hypothetical protein
MKVTDLRRKLLAALAAGGMLAPSAVHAAPLNTNLLVNGDFEHVDINVSQGGLRAVKILDWTAGNKMGFAYSHDGAVNGLGQTIPDYANGLPLASGGHFYFTSNATVDPVNGNDVTGPGQFAQDIDVSTGPSGTLIATGTAAFRASAFFSGYSTDGDFGNVQLSFRNGTNELGTALVPGPDPSSWTQNSGGGLIPIGTTTVRVSVFGTALSGGPDGYMDNVDFQVTNEIIQPVLQLTINRATGGMTVRNRTGGLENLSGYQITSPFGSLVPANWLSISDNYDAGSPGLNQFDAVHNWNELTESVSRGDLSEADLDLAGGGTGASLAHNGTINLGNSGTWIQNPNEDLVFQYVSGGQILQGIVTYTGNNDVPFEVGDLTGPAGSPDGSINSLDWVVLRTNQHTNLSSFSLAEAYRRGDLNSDKRNDFADFVAFKSLYDAANGAGSFVAMLASIPEPSTLLLVLAYGVFALPARRRTPNR